MENELQAATEAGAAFVAAAERFADEFREEAASYDRAGAFPTKHLDALRDSGFLYAPIPVEAGGAGVESIHDTLVASSRLARGDAGLTLGVNMHLLVLQSLVRQRRIAFNRDSDQKAEALTSILRGFAKGGAFVAAAQSEPDQNLLRPTTTVSNVDGTWRLNGIKIISSGSPVATHFSVSATIRDECGERYVYALVSRDTLGVRVLDDWDALGMRDSGSCSVIFDNVELPNFRAGKGTRAGVITPEHLEEILSSGLAHGAASLGVAEAAHQEAIRAVCKKRQKAPDQPIRGFVQERAAENSIDLAAARAVFSRAAALIDEYQAEHPSERGTIAEVSKVFAEGQRAKAFVNAAAVRIADRSLAMAGGAGFMNKAPLSRYYRDARAGAFMHPLGANVAIEYLGAHTLGLRPRTF
ncbi:MAG: acyl-CoA dehydrogenase family protein [Dehalococcoidia bacterium]